MHEICQIGAHVFALQEPGGDWSKVPVLGGGGNKFCELVKPASTIKWDDGVGGTGTHGITAADVSGSGSFAEVVQALCAWIEDRAVAAAAAAGKVLPPIGGSDVVACLVAHNGMAGSTL